MEDIHRGIIDTEQLSQFPTPGRGRGSIEKGREQEQQEGNHQRIQAVPVAMENSSRPSVLRRPSVSNKLGNNGQGGYEQRNRRQNTAPTHQSSNTSLSSNYRKNMVTTVEEGSKRRRPSVATNSLTPPIPQKEYIPGSGYSKTADGAFKVPVSARNSKSKSLQPPPRQGKPSLSPEHGRTQSTALPPKSPKSPSFNKLNTPQKGGIPLSGSSRRISTIPHASGLGARTVSPTDARRLKRLSAINTPTPPTLPLSLEDARSAPGSPSMIPKSVTPSSSATTPEPQRKSYSSGLSTTSTSTSARTSVGSLQPKLSHNLAVSRLPKPPRPTTVEREEEIPPVPPLPKDLASPAVQNFGDTGFNPNAGRKSGNSMFGPRKDSLPTEPEIFDMEPDRPALPEKPKFAEKLERFEKAAEKPVKADKETRRRRGMTLGGMSMGQAINNLESKSSSSSLRKKDLIPLRLPPLNLLPLSTPTIARVNALGPQSDSDELTPPPKRTIKTPSTPMTASKAGFFGKGRDRDEVAYGRSTSSFNQSTHQVGDSPSSLSLRAGSSAGSSIPISASSRMGRQTISPYVSSSLPKGTPTAENDGKDYKGSRILGMTLPGTGPARDNNNKSRARKSQDSVRSGPPQEDTLLDTPSSSSIRRKLSLSWKKSSSSKHSHAATERAEEYAAQKYDAMPPPKLPASATWAGPINHPPSPVRLQKNASQGGGQGRRKSSIGNGTFPAEHGRSDSWSKDWTQNGKEKATEHATQQQFPPPPVKSSTGSGILGPMTKMLSSKHSLGQLRSNRTLPPQAPAHGDPMMDHDDLLAEEEMKKIASKRKNLDAMAQELEELKRRATPKERVSPPQALRTISLNIFERGEIVDYKEIYFCGTSDAKKHVGDLNATSLPNFGYDDERGDYMIVKGDHLAYRYEVVDVLGKGSFGQVVRCVDHKTGGLVAVKIIRNKKRFHQQALVEVNILQKLKEWVCYFLNGCWCNLVLIWWV